MACPGCPMGTYNYTINAHTPLQVSRCEPCPPGTWSNIRGAISDEVCQPCPIHTYSPEYGM